MTGRRIVPDSGPATDAALFASREAACAAGAHLPYTVQPPDAIYGPALRRREAGETYCLHCLAVIS